VLVLLRAGVSPSQPNDLKPARKLAHRYEPSPPWQGSPGTSPLKHQTVSTVLEQFPGNVQLWFHFQDHDEDMGVSLVSNFKVDFNEEVQVILDEMEVRFQFQLEDRI
jgi:hypothetical protein